MSDFHKHDLSQVVILCLGLSSREGCAKAGRAGLAGRGRSHTGATSDLGLEAEKGPTQAKSEPDSAVEGADPKEIALNAFMRCAHFGGEAGSEAPGASGVSGVLRRQPCIVECSQELRCIALPDMTIDAKIPQTEINPR